MCAYCGKRRAVNKDHVVPRSLRRKHRGLPAQFLGTEPSCFACNIAKGARRLVPPSWADKVAQLNAYFGGTPWRVWDGDPALLREVAR